MNWNAVIFGGCVGAIIGLLLNLIPAFNRMMLPQKQVVSIPVVAVIILLMHYLFL